MNSDFAKMRCPVCGTQTGARLNKNGIIYIYCPNGHHARLSREDSSEAVRVLKSGQSWNNGIVFIYPEQQKNERKLENDGNNGTTNGTNTSDYNGRTNGQPAANSAFNSGTSASDGDESDGDDFAFGLI